MWRLRAPSARRRPISRMRSSTDTSMMFMTPTPPMPSVSVPMNTSSTCRPMVMPSMIGPELLAPEHLDGALVGGREALALADRLPHLLHRLLARSTAMTAAKTITLA